MKVTVEREGRCSTDDLVKAFAEVLGATPRLIKGKEIVTALAEAMQGFDDLAKTIIYATFSGLFSANVGVPILIKGMCFHCCATHFEEELTPMDTEDLRPYEGEAKALPIGRCPVCGELCYAYVAKIGEG
jgi:hypothetical protein